VPLTIRQGRASYNGIIVGNSTADELVLLMRREEHTPFVLKPGHLPAKHEGLDIDRDGITYNGKRIGHVFELQTMLAQDKMEIIHGYMFAIGENSFKRSAHEERDHEVMRPIVETAALLMEDFMLNLPLHETLLSASVD
jgi:hypothetical protein